MRRTHTVCIALFALFLWMPAVQRMARPFPSFALDGVENLAPGARFTLRNWLSGEYAKQYEAYHDEHIGFRGPLVRTYNQVQYSVFRRIPGRRGTQIVRGQGHWLYESEYIRRMRQPGHATAEELAPLAVNLKRLQDALQTHGVAMLVVVSPSKPAIYPEHLPEEMKPAGAAPDNEYTRLMPLLNRHGVRCVDAHRIFETTAPTAPYPLFTPGGTHWNHYGAFVVVQEMLKSLREASGKALPAPECRWVALLPPKGADNDLGLLLNLWHYPGASVPAPYPRPVIPDRGAKHRPSILFVGDSFVFTLLDVIRAGDLSPLCHLLYYNKRLFTYRDTNHETDHALIPNWPVSGDEFDWNALVLGKDAVVLEVNEIRIGEIGWGFIDDALRRLEPTAPPAGGR